MPLFSSPSSDLDALYINYLNVLDKYTKLRAQQTNDFSTAFLSLAQARFRAPPATAHVGFGAVLADGGRRGREPRIGMEIGEGEGGTGTDGITNRSRPRHQMSLRKQDGRSQKKGGGEKEELDDAAAAVVVDPLRLFGLIEPTGLKDAQHRFETAIENAVDLVRVQRELLHLEEEIERLKKERKEENGTEKRTKDEEVEKKAEEKKGKDDGKKKGKEEGKGSWGRRLSGRKSK